MEKTNFSEILSEYKRSLKSRQATNVDEAINVWVVSWFTLGYLAGYLKCSWLLTQEEEIGLKTLIYTEEWKSQPQWSDEHDKTGVNTPTMRTDDVTINQ